MHFDTLTKQGVFMKKIILATTILLCPLLHASTYVCNQPANQGGKKIAVVSLNRDGVR